jgi:hypothetical protein
MVQLLKRLFPCLSVFDISSEGTDNYNCFAWAAGDSTARWEPTEGYYWPPGAPREISVDAVIRAFEFLGYEETTGDTLESAYEKVAIFADADGEPTHAARQLENGGWTSKLGNYEDIEHDRLSELEGPKPCYGKVVRLLRRSRPTPVAGERQRTLSELPM